MAETKQKVKFYLGTGRRKTAVARVRIAEGKGQITINARSLTDYFTEDKDRAAVEGPMLVTDLRSRLDVAVTVRGGGFTGQAGAVSQGLARAIKNMFGPTEPQQPAPAAAPTAEVDGVPAAAGGARGPVGMVKKLRDSGFLTRDSRMKERKKYGRKGARKSFQFSKR